MSKPKRQTPAAVGKAATTRALLTRLGPLIGLIFVWGLFAVVVGGSFVGWPNQRLILLQSTVVATAAIGATLIIISGGIDLSVGSSIAFGTMLIALILDLELTETLPDGGERVVWSALESMPILWPIIALIGGILGGAVIGLSIGAMVIGHVGRVAALLGGGLIVMWTWSVITPYGAIAAGIAAAAALWVISDRFLKRVELSPFIVTLGMWGALRGAAKGLGDNQPIYPDQSWLTDLMQTSDSGIGSVMAPGVWIMIVLAIAIACMLRFARFGRHIFAIGSNEETARLCGINVERTKLALYSVAIACTGLAALMQFSFLTGQGDPVTAEGYELKVIAAVVIGGASLSGGEGSILGTIAGVLIMFVVDNGCTQLGLDNWVQEIVTGAIIVAAVALDRLRHRRMT